MLHNSNDLNPIKDESNNIVWRPSDVPELPTWMMDAPDPIEPLFNAETELDLADLGIEEPTEPTIKTGLPAINTNHNVPAIQVEINNETAFKFVKTQEPVTCPVAETENGYALIFKHPDFPVSECDLVRDRPKVDLRLRIGMDPNLEWLEGAGLEHFRDGLPSAPGWLLTLIRSAMEWKPPAANSEVVHQLKVPQTQTINILPNGQKIAQVYDVSGLYFKNVEYREVAATDQVTHQVTRRQFIEVSPTGTGKTYAALQRAYSIVLVPYRPLAYSTVKDYERLYSDNISVVMGGKEIKDGANRFVCVYDSIDRLIQWLDNHQDEYGDFWKYFLLTVDEWHQSVYSGRHRPRAINAVKGSIEMFWNTRITTATPLPLMPGTHGFVRVDYLREVPHERNVYRGLIGGTAKAIDQIIKMKRAFGENPVVILLQNSKKVNLVVEEQLKEYNCIQFNSDQKKSDSYIELTSTQSLPEDCSVILATSLWQDGHNVFSNIEKIDMKNRSVVMLVVNNKLGRFGAIQIEQAASRIRDAKYIEVILSMDFAGEWPTVVAGDKEIQLIGDQWSDIPAIFNSLKTQAETMKPGVLMGVKENMRFYKDLDEKDFDKSMVTPFIDNLGFRLVKDVNNEWDLEIDKTLLRTRAQEIYDRACWECPALMIHVLNDISQSIYNDCGHFALKTALDADEKEEFKDAINAVKANQLERQVNALNDYREKEASEIRKAVQDPDCSTEEQQTALFVSSCLSANIEKESAIDHILEMSKKRTLSYDNVKEWITTRACLMKIRRRSSWIEIDNEDAYRQMLMRWKPSDIITDDMLWEWIDKHEGRLLVKPSDDPNTRLMYARKLIKQAYGAKWVHGAFVIETLDPLPNLKFSKPEIKFPEGEVGSDELVKRLRSLALWADQQRHKKLDAWCEQESDKKQPLELLEKVAHQKTQYVNKPAKAQIVINGRATNIILTSQHANQMADLIEQGRKQTPPTKKELTADEVKVLIILKRSGKPMTAGQIRKKTSTKSAERMKLDRVKSAIEGLLNQNKIKKQAESSKRYPKYCTINSQ